MQKNALGAMWNHKRKMSFRRGRNDAELKMHNLAVANLRYYQLSCAAASRNENVSNLQ